MIEYLTRNQVKLLNRIKTADRMANVLKLFFEIGYREKKDVYNQLTIHFPKYKDRSLKDDFTLFWAFRLLDLKIVEDLEIIIDKINAL